MSFGIFLIFSMRKIIFSFCCSVFSLLAANAQITNATVCLNGNIVLSVPGNINDYVGGQWSPASDLTDTDTLTPTFTPTATGEYTFTFTAKNIGAGLFPNGDFESGNTGFYSEYTFVPPTDDQTLWVEGNFTITNMPKAVHANSPCNTVSERGYMMAVNGGSRPSTIVWRPATLAVTPNTDYAFSAWIMRWTESSPAQLQFQINGVNLGAVQTPPNNPCEWGQVYVIWNSGADTTADITLLNMQTSPSGNDFAIDDISFALSNDITYTFNIKVVECNFTENLIMCREESKTLNAGDFTVYTDPQWTPATGLSSANVSRPTFTPASTGLQTYVFTGKNPEGLTITKTFNITVNPSPVLFSAAPVGRELQVLANTNTGALQPFVYLVNGTDAYLQPVISGLNIGTHTLVVVNTAGCRSREMEFTIAPVDVVPDKFFSPNEDGINDVWNIAGIDFYKDAVVEIYDRSGKMLAKYEGDFNGWDGKFNGKLLPSTDYWYIIKIDEINKRETGHFSLKR